MSWISSLLGGLLNNLNYGTILFLMLLESTVVPVPSELVVSPAAYHAAGGHLNVWLVILFATIGADLGASINYAAGYWLGRPIIYRFANSRLGHLCLLNQEKVEKSEHYFNDHGAVATITGRLLIGIRHLISIPAGLAKMNYWRFLLYTTIGAGVWHAILAALGWYLHSIVPESELNDRIVEYGDYIKWTIIALVAQKFFVCLVAHFILGSPKWVWLYAYRHTDEGIALRARNYSKIKNKNLSRCAPKWVWQYAYRHTDEGIALRARNYSKIKNKN